MGVYVRFHSNSKESLFIAIKRILKYLSAIIEYGVLHSKDSNLNLVGYLDVDWVNNDADKKKHYWSGIYILVVTWQHGLVRNIIQYYCQL